MTIASARPGSGQPMMEMNTTPLIDVMLVLLIMFIITIPVATNSTEFNVSAGAPVIDRPIDPVVNRLEVTAADQIMWNGRAVSETQLTTLLMQSRQRPVEPELQYQPDAQASYDLAARVTRDIKRSGVTKFGFVGNERFAEFGKPSE
ncbi:biopolymer transporter ExbD [Novosphingobium sp. G106]|uniref:ExbD/TolR family protein n=1 Tax=Novosphingobium sp. G106 TaxID=2849500 RepID=UPI001C2D7275|nr:biopolymer transporter ExbD [Novosphingobium sp. G106]MBV1689827.1 biopolymer transporter ExbD [Novosphingobium sp. G106]